MNTLQERFAALFGTPYPRGLGARIARLCHVAPASVSNWLNNPEKVSTISRTHAELIIRHYGFDVSPLWLSEGLGPRDLLEEEQPLGVPQPGKPKNPAREIANSSDNGHMLQNVTDGPDPHGPYPLISEVQAGVWTEIYDNFQPGDADDWLPSAKNLGRCGYLLRVRGKSMYAPGERFSFSEGMILHVNPDLEPQPGQFVIVRRESAKAATFKRYVLIEGTPYLEAINPNWPPDEKYLKLQAGDAWCGVVVSASMDDLP